MVTQDTPAVVTLPSARTLLYNSLIAALIGSALMIFVHELAHLVAGLALGHPGTLYSFGVFHHGNPTPTDEAVMALAAPVFSLVTGVAMQLWTPLRRRGDFLHLVWVWFAFASVQEGVAYLCLTPMGAGDTAVAARMLGWPIAVQILMLLLGGAGMFANARAFAPHMARFAGADPQRRNAVTLFPWLYGMIATVLLSLLYLTLSPADLPAGPQIAILAAGTAILVFAPMAHIFASRVREVAPEPLRLQPVPVGGLVVLGAVIVFGNVLLSQGLRIG